MKILVLDVSTTDTGYSTYTEKGYVKSGSVKRKEKDWLTRVLFMKDEIKKVCTRPDFLVIEAGFKGKNVLTLKKLCVAQGIFIGTYPNTPVYFVYPKEWQEYFSFHCKRNEIKERSMKKASALVKKEITNDNESDSILVGQYFVDVKLKNVTNSEVKEGIKVKKTKGVYKESQKAKTRS